MTSIQKLRQLTQVDLLSGWRCHLGDLPMAQALQPTCWQHWQPVQLNPKRHIAWSRGLQVLWLGQLLAIPPDLYGYRLEGLALRLALRWWAQEAQIFVGGQLVREGDLFDCFSRLLLRSAVEAGEVISIAIRLVSPGHDDGALVESRCIYEHSENPHLDPGFVADELFIINRAIAFKKNPLALHLEQLNSSLNSIDWSALPNDGEAFERSLNSLHQQLNLYRPLLPSQLSLMGHAHLDMAWLWPVSETWEAAQRTFESVLNLQQAFPNLIFSHSTPALYAWIEDHRPDLFAQIQQQVRARRWEIAAGLWVEPEFNLISGESIVRQVLYAQRYVKDKFGQVSAVAWLPDSFGFCWQLPQILKQGEIDYFVTQKLSWNDTTVFPYDLFWWQSPDGSKIFSFMSPPIGQDIDPVQMATYALNWQQKTGVSQAIWLPGVGDHGGGPTREMLEVAQRWQQSSVFPELEFTSATAYLRHLEKGLADDPTHSPLPLWKDELYFEFHRGCYTTHAEQKRSNRRCEQLLYQAELLASFAQLLAGVSYPKTELETAWKTVLFNQFHDILPGSSIPDVYVDANDNWREVERIGSQILERSLEALWTQIALPSPPQPDAQPIWVFNPLNWTRSQVVSVSLPDSDNPWQVCDLAGQPLVTQQVSDSTLIFSAHGVPGLGYRVFWLCRQRAETRATALSDESGCQKNLLEFQCITSIPKKQEIFQTNNLEAKNWVLENEWLRVTIDPQTGELSSLFDKANHRESLGPDGGNQLQAFHDRGQYWDAWNIDPNYAQNPLPAPTLKSIQWVEQGRLRSCLRVVRQLNQSQFCQDYILEAATPLLKIATTVDWQDRHILVKAAFHLNLEADFATYEIPCGAIRRTTQPQTPAEQAKWEVSALHWADLTSTPNDQIQSAYGVSLLNDCKYGYDAQSDRLRLTLLRGSTWPDPEADGGIHQFTYAIYPHRQTWQQAQTVRRGYELNVPLLVRRMSSTQEPSQVDHSNNDGMKLPPEAQLLELSAENLILMAFKQSEDDPDRWILRCYECHGDEAELELGGRLNLEFERPVNLLEHPLKELDEGKLEGNRVRIDPWKIASFRLYFA